MPDVSALYFEPGDLIAVFGGEIGQDGKKADSVCLSTVLIVGQEDLIVEDASQTTFTVSKRTYTVPKSICHKLSLDPDALEENDVLKPHLSDLVLSYTRDRYKSAEDKNITGILYKIEYKLGKPDTATLICGKEMCEVPFTSLIVLQKNTKD